MLLTHSPCLTLSLTYFKILQITSNSNAMVMEFDDMHLRQDLLRGVYGYGYEKPSPIQQRAIVPITQGNFLLSDTTASKRSVHAFILESIGVECIAMCFHLCTQAQLIYTLCTVHS